MSEYILPHVDGYLKLGQDFDCSDIHLAVNSRPTWRRFGQLLPIWEEAPNLTPQDTEVLARGFLEDPEWNRLQLKGDVDFAYANDFGRYRASVVKQRLGYDICFRIINTRVRTMEEIGLPTEYVVPLTRYTNGLILVTGSVGSGKSTTLASIVDFINQDRHDHIITLEDPIEYLIPSKNCHVNQREVHKHTESFARALRGALREDPDVIMVGEMRDLETISLALTAAETGLLVFGMLIDNGLKGLEDLFNGLKEFRLVLVALFNLLQDFLNVRVHCSTSKYNNAFFVMRAAQFGFTPRIKLIINLRYTNVKLIVRL